jgi:hypothetical protein
MTARCRVVVAPDGSEASGANVVASAPLVALTADQGFAWTEAALGREHHASRAIGIAPGSHSKRSRSGTVSKPSSPPARSRRSGVRAQSWASPAGTLPRACKGQSGSSILPLPTKGVRDEASEARGCDFDCRRELCPNRCRASFGGGASSTSVTGLQRGHAESWRERPEPEVGRGDSAYRACDPD